MRSVVYVAAAYAICTGCAEAFAPAAPAAGLMPSLSVVRPAGKTTLNMAPSKVKNDKPDDFATYMAKRKAAAEGRVWVPEGGSAPAPAAAAPAAAAPAYAPPAAPAQQYAPPAAAAPAAPPAAAAPATPAATVEAGFGGEMTQAQKDAQMAKFLNARYAPHVEQERQATAAFYQKLGFSAEEARRVASRIVSIGNTPVN